MTTCILAPPANYVELKNCEYMGTCPVFDRFEFEGIRNFWIRLYCQGTRQSMCARRLIRMTGLPVADDMLPNGEILPP